MEFHAVDVDQLEAVFARRLVEPPEDIGLVEILVAHPLFVQQCRKPGECVEHGSVSGAGNRLVTSASGVQSDWRDMK